MTREEAVRAVVEILEEVAGVSPVDVTERSTFGTDDLDVDSLSMVEVVVVAEERFGIRIPDGDVESIKTVGDLVDRAVATVTELPISDIHISRLRLVTRDDGCALYQPKHRRPAAVWLPDGADPDPREWRALYAGDWPEEQTPQGVEA